MINQNEDVLASIIAMLLENMNIQIFENESDIKDKTKMGLFGAKHDKISK